MSQKRLTEMCVDQPQTSQSMDLWIGISVSVKWLLGTKRSDIDALKTHEKATSANQEFDKIGSPPMPLNMAFLDEGKGIAPTLDNQAKWHKNCRNRFSDLKLDREISKS